MAYRLNICYFDAAIVVVDSRFGHWLENHLLASGASSLGTDHLFSTSALSLRFQRFCLSLLGQSRLDRECLFGCPRGIIWITPLLNPLINIQTQLSHGRVASLYAREGSFAFGLLGSFGLGRDLFFFEVNFGLVRPFAGWASVSLHSTRVSASRNVDRQCSTGSSCVLLASCKFFFRITSHLYVIVPHRMYHSPQH